MIRVQIRHTLLEHMHNIINDQQQHTIPRNLLSDHFIRVYKLTESLKVDGTALVIVIYIERSSYLKPIENILTVHVFVWDTMLVNDSD
jgi:uncharacterized protein Smg (DUF494 family)